MLLEGKTALVTGGSRGIGRAIVEAFLNAGADVACYASKKGQHEDELQQQATELGRNISFYYADVASLEEFSKSIEQTLKDNPQGIDILVNNAGITHDGLLFAMKEEQWDRVLRVNLYATFFSCKILARHMAMRKQGSIINVSSVAALLGSGGQTNYAAAKAGVIGFSKSLAKEVASRGVRVNVLAPGYTETDMTAKLSDKQRQRVIEHIPLARTAQTDEIAQVALFLASGMSSYLTGQTLAADGGMAM